MKRIFFILALSITASGIFAQEDKHWGKLTVTGSVQSDMLVPSELTNDMTEHFMTNTYIDLRVMNRHIEAGARFEFLEYPMPGYEADFKGYGVPHAYVRLFYSKWDLTLGTFYEQFGSGFILRTYEERSLGIDNSLLGARLALKPCRGVSFKALAGTQRTYWDISRTLISGADIELGLDEWIRPLANSGTRLMIGGSWVNKYEKDEIHMVGAYRLNFPTCVNAFDIRANMQTGGFNILAEYAVKGQDPTIRNGYIFREGNVAMLSASYSQKGLSVLLQAKRSDNMTFRSVRGDNHFMCCDINHLPAFTMDHTYSLAALYPYATNANGEWAYQLEAGYKFKKGSALGGKYGTSIKLNASHVRAIDINPIGGEGTDGYSSKFFNWGNDTYYQDINVQLDKKFSKVFKLNLMYMNQRYNKTAVENHGGMIHSNIFIAEGKFQFSRKVTLRAEAQYLSTKDDEGDWVFGLLELSLAPHWMLTGSDMYNSGLTKEHYYQGAVTFNHGAHRLQAGYGRTRAGFNCTGGVCRRVPETKGVTISYNYNF